MTTCKVCGRQFPDDCCAPVTVSTAATKFKLVVCGVCALEMINRSLGTNRQSFQGEQAEEMRQRAVAHLKAQGVPA